MGKRCMLVVVTAVIIGLMCTTVFAGNAAPVKVNNTICPVTGDKVDMRNPVTVEYNGKVYNLCCPACVAPFKGDPEKYIKKMAEENKGK